MEEPTDNNEAADKPFYKDKDWYIATAKTHFSRVFTWRLQKVEPTPAEQSTLEATGSQSPVFQTYLVWRRSILCVAILPLFVGFVSGWMRVSKVNTGAEMEAYDDDGANGGGSEGTDPPSYVPSDGEMETYMLILTASPQDIYTFLGQIVYYQVLPSLATTILLMASAHCAYKWTKWGESSKALRAAWMLTLVMPLVPALFPARFLIKDSFEARMQAASQQTYRALMDSLKLERTTNYSITILPILLTLPSGASTGALKIWGLLPESNLASLILLFMQPFTAIITLISFVVMLQLFGNVQMMIGTFLLTIAPLFYLLRRELYVGEATEENEKKVNCNQRTMTIVRIGGLLLIVIMAFEPQDDGRALIGFSEESAVLLFENLITVLFETWGRSLITTAVFSDILVQMMVINGNQIVDVEKFLLMDSDMKIGEEEKEPGKMAILMNKMKSKMPKKDNVEDGGSASDDPEEAQPTKTLDKTDKIED